MGFRLIQSLRQFFLHIVRIQDGKKGIMLSKSAKSRGFPRFSLLLFFKRGQTFFTITEGTSLVLPAAVESSRLRLTDD